MSTVDKMLIKGIRSFDPENKNVTTFFRPLTLIVGPNGAGKTTIIECLKLSCTGELPPNARSGHSFIHDPKVAGETETKGQIKLRFKTAAGKDVVCIRSFQLTQKASKMEYKAIESVLQTINPHTGEKVCLSYRCADMDREIPALMGVSKSILENVIFVHQDEANWPLQDPSTLKKKFDDIFSATSKNNDQTMKEIVKGNREGLGLSGKRGREEKEEAATCDREDIGSKQLLYTKALEVIKKLHKDQAQEIKTYKLKLENLQTLKDAAYKLRESIAQDQEKTETLAVQMEEIDKSVKNVDAKIHHTEATLKDLRRLQDQITMKTAQRSTLFKEKEKQYEALAEENEDTDEELLEWKTKFGEKIALLNSKIRKLEREMNDIETKSSLLKEGINESIWEISKLQRDADEHMKLKNDRDQIIQKLFGRHNLGNLPNIPFSDEVAANLANRINSRLLDLDRDLQDKKSSITTQLEVAWERYMDANGRCKDIDAKKQAKLEIKSGILERIKEKEKERDLYDPNISDVDLEHLDESEKNLLLEVERKSNQLAVRDFKNVNEEKQVELNAIERKIKDLHHEKDILFADSEDRVRQTVKKRDLETLKKKHKKMQVKALIDDHKERVRRVLKGRLPSDKEWKKEVTQALSALTTEFNDLNAKSREADKEVNLVQMKIQETNKSLSKLHKDMDKYNIADGMRQMFDPFERVARAHHICPCCERPFSYEEEDEFVKKQRVKAASSAEHMKVLAVESSNADSHFQQLEKLHMAYEEYAKIGKETIPLVEKNLYELNAELDQKSQALDDVLGVLAQIKADKDLVEALVQPIETADRLFHEIQGLQKEVQDLEYKLDYGGQGVKSVEEIQLELKTLQSTRYYLSYGKLALSYKALGPLDKEKDQLLRDHYDLKGKLDAEYEEQAEAKRKYQQEVETLRLVTSKIREYDSLGIGEKLQELKNKHCLSVSQLQSCEIRKQEISSELKKSEDVMGNQDQLKRNIEDNLNYRKTKAEVDKLTNEIDSLEERTLEIGRVSSFEAELAKLTRERESLLSELNRCHGTLSVYQSNVAKNKIDLKQAQYKDIDKRYFDQLIQLKTTEMANKDLDRYYNALDKWQTYRGQDIDYISIHSDSEGAGTRSYSYRVLMQTGDAELEMRGRCSAGQKSNPTSKVAGRSYNHAQQTCKQSLSTSVIDVEIPVTGQTHALNEELYWTEENGKKAETFCLNCGILALDEPTTNLDGPNAESLAAALLRIMEDRKGQENFQLIVITHDERFAQLIGRRQHAEKYYRVTKDDQLLFDWLKPRAISSDSLKEDLEPVQYSEDDQVAEEVMGTQSYSLYFISDIKKPGMSKEDENFSTSALSSSMSLLFTRPLLKSFKSLPNSFWIFKVTHLPIRTPPGAKALLSPNTAFLFTVMLQRSQSFSTLFPATTATNK
ncbi:hypothetical protein RJ639_046423 [Escallonia herrerae]|uniref:Zinc-hook domain-containing protein n=1 Tax=Escallonia herrerae TaxID=1293975 RepID=A0AA89AXA8_9ASTE|nr:hypothetical protein RJ639_046423 [Escallonia herrerae]